MTATTAPPAELLVRTTRRTLPGLLPPAEDDADDRRPRWPAVAEAMLAAAVLLAGLALLPLPILGADFGALPGTLDSRFNLCVLEHGWRWLAGREPSFWNAPFFYPQPLITAYSDNHLGTLPLYALFRAAGLDRETAFQGWFLALFPLNYLAGYWALRKFRLGPAGAAAGAYVFAFGLPVVGQMEHLQLLPRFPAPLAVWFAVRVCEHGRGRDWLGLGAMVAWQLYCSIYLGYFLGLFLTAFVPAYLALRRPEVLRGWLPGGDAWALVLPAGLLLVGLTVRPTEPGCLAVLVALALGDALRRLGVRGWARWFWTGPCGGSRRAALARLAGGALFLVVLAPLLTPYLRVFRARAGDGQPVPVILAMVPRPESWVTASPASALWGWCRTPIAERPYGGEHSLFLGALPTVAVLAALPLAVLHRRRGRSGAAFAAALFAFAALFALLLHTPAGSLYEWLFVVPGATAIRAVSRVVLILLLPAGLALGYWLTLLEERLRGRVGPALAALAAVAVLPLVLADQLAACGRIDTVDKVALQQQTRRAADEVRQRYPDALLLVNVRPDAAVPDRRSEVWDVGRQLFGMEVAQALGVRTINGYSAINPPGWATFHSWADVAQWRQAVRGRVRGSVLRRDPHYAAHGFDGLAVLGELSGSAAAPLSVAVSPLPPAGFRGRLRAAGPMPRLVADRYCRFAVDVSNDSALPWPALSWNGHQFRIGLSYRWISLEGDELEERNAYRAWLEEDVAPGATTRVNLELRAPEEPGRYLLEIDMLQEQVVWFSERGVAPLRLEVEVAAE